MMYELEAGAIKECKQKSKESGSDAKGGFLGQFTSLKDNG